MSLQSLILTCCSALSHLSGVEHVSALARLGMDRCGMTNLQPLCQLGEGLLNLHVPSYNTLQEEALECHMSSPHDVDVRYSNEREVVLAGG
jgi:hypothetical protein